MSSDRETVDLGDTLPPLPIFPLPSVQLFPHALLPLHVFEPRYRSLVKDAMAGNQLVAMPMLESSGDKGPRPKVRAICGVGKIISYDPMPDGRSNILLEGVCRARIVEELSVASPYRVVRVDELPDLGDGLQGGSTMMLLANELAARIPDGGDTLRELLRGVVQPGPLSDVLASALLADSAERQRLLEMRDVAERVEVMTHHLGQLLSRFASSSSN